MKKQEKIYLCHVLLTVIIFPKNIQSIFTLTLLLKTIEKTVAVVNYIMEYQLNFNKIEEIKITSSYKADTSLYLLNNTKKILVCSLIEPYRL